MNKKIRILVSTIIGKPNAGKSSLLNSLLKESVSIISNKPQTTRDQITGIYSDEANTEQFVFTDTPGIHKSKTELGKKMNEYSYSSIKDIDLVLFLSPIDYEVEEIDLEIISNLENVKNKIAIVTKIDLAKDHAIVEQRALFLKEKGFTNVLAYSTKNEATRNLLLSELRSYSYEGFALYENDYYTDKPMRFIAKELIRESLLESLDHEVPHNIAVEIEEYNEARDDQLTEIKAVIYVARDSQKGIVIGEGGKMIKSIGMKSRKKIEDILQEKIVLKTKVKVSKNWINDKISLKKLGY
ncbi:GTPase Era [[Mycoplasma] mobile]|uniref:GTPase Era n=1 Tax=Mycoplasma mobile (strain ATCC 43663 / 163K / NCTC 11711) TaxID=267748 RepID=Q6KHU6_MYCM1|nr:GTPase Era [[Mycoplasma] mobile]AAT27832.1 GTP-binding protein era [Mycoplasma mobile 163K]